MIEAADADESGTLNYLELRAAISWWYLHVEPAKVQGARGIKLVLPWVMTSATGCACSVLVALVSAKFSQEVTVAWMMTTVLGLLWKMLIFDPLKALCCGTLIDPLYAFLTCDFSVDSLLETLEEMMETASEDNMGDGHEDHGGGAVATEAARQAAMAVGDNSMFLVNHTTTVAVANKFKSKTSKASASRLKDSMIQDDEALQLRTQQQKAQSNHYYADKIAAKRLAAGLDKGEFAEKADKQTAQLPSRATRPRAHTQRTATQVNQLLSNVQNEQTEIANKIELQRNSSRQTLQEKLQEKRSKMQPANLSITADGDDETRPAEGAAGFIGDGEW